MSGDLTPMQRAEQAVHRSLEHAGAFRGGRALKGVAPDDVRNAIVAGLEVLAEEFGPRPADAAPPVRELPTERGAVIFATEVRGIEFDHPRLMVFGIDGDSWQGVTPFDGYQFHCAENIQQWMPATVIPTAAHDHVRAALRAIADESRFDSLEPAENVLADLRELAAEAVNVLDGEVRR